MRSYIALVALVLGSCASTADAELGPLTSGEEQELAAGRRSVVWLELLVIEDGNRSAPRPFANSGLVAGLGSFATGGWIETVKLRALDDVLEEQGSYFVLVEPGVHFLSFRDVRTVTRDRSLPFDGLPVWSLDVPRGDTAYDAGRLILNTTTGGLIVVQDEGTKIATPAASPSPDAPIPIALRRHRGTRTLRHPIPPTAETPGR